jgi:adenylate cyclase
MDATVLSVAATAAAAMDGDKHENLPNNADISSPAYRDLERFLRQLRDANRRADTYVKFIYTLRADPKQAGVQVFGVDAEEDGSDKSHPGEVHKFKGGVPLKIDQLQVQPDMIEHQWGTWLTANAPIKNSAGHTVAAVSVDIAAHDVVEKFNTLLITGLISLLASIALAVGLALFLSRRIAQPLALVRSTVQAIGRGDFTARTDLKSNDEFGEVAMAINEMAVGLQQRENLKNTLVRFVSSHVAENILQSGEMPELKGERRKITVLFSDVRGFTTLSERFAPEQVVALLNDYFDKMVEAVLANHGTVDKFIGDGLMAIFGAPGDDTFQEEHAIQAALSMREAMKELTERWTNLDFRIGIGINTGIAVVGNIGSKDRMQYTAVGDTVNLSARIESATKELHTDIAVSEYTYVAARSRFHMRELNTIQVKGRTDSVRVYGVDGVRELPGDPRESA